MKVTQEQLPDSQVGLQIEIPADVSQQTYEKVLQKLIKTVRIPGFRPGKVPRQVFIQRFGSGQIKAAALEELVQTAVESAIKQESIEAIGNYQLTSEFDELMQQYVPGEALTFQASVDVPPRVTLKQYTGLSAQAEEVVFSEARVDEVLEGYRRNLATLVPVEDRNAQMGDVVIVDFAGEIRTPEGTYEPFEGGKAEDFQLEMKPGTFIEGFIEGIVGMALEETKTLDLSFPESYPQAELAGQAVRFTVTLKDIKQKELPDLDDDFAQEVSDFETLEELRASLRARYQKEAEERTEANQFEAILNKLLEHLEAEIPETLIRQEANFLVQQAVVQLSQQGVDVNRLLTPEIVENMRDRSRPDAIARLRRTLALGEVAKQESLAADPEQVATRMAEILEEVQDPASLDRDRLQQMVTEELLQETILKWLVEHNTIELVPEGTLTSKDKDKVDAEAGTVDDSGDAAAADVAREAVEIDKDSEAAQAPEEE